jgi:hypothetical protein
MSEKKALLSILRCPIHHKFWAISLDDEDGCGTRLTPDKCCGRWDAVVRFALTPNAINDIIAELECARERIEDDE